MSPNSPFNAARLQRGDSSPAGHRDKQHQRRGSSHPAPTPGISVDNITSAPEFRGKQSDNSFQDSFYRPRLFSAGCDYRSAGRKSCALFRQRHRSQSSRISAEVLVEPEPRSPRHISSAASSTHEECDDQHTDDVDDDDSSSWNRRQLLVRNQNCLHTMLSASLPEAEELEAILPDEYALAPNQKMVGAQQLSYLQVRRQSAASMQKPTDIVDDDDEIAQIHTPLLNEHQPPLRLTSIGREANVLDVETYFRQLPPRSKSVLVDDISVTDSVDLNLLESSELSRDPHINFLVGSSVSLSQLQTTTTKSGPNDDETNALRVSLHDASSGSTVSVSSANGLMCRICHQYAAASAEALISPCRCDGSLRYVHKSCLLKWLRISACDKNKKPRCELCSFAFLLSKRINWRGLRLPSLSVRDKVYHALFCLTLALMLICAVVTTLVFRKEREAQAINYLRRQAGVKLDAQAIQDLHYYEVVTLICGILFFVGFFIAMFAELKVQHSIVHVVRLVLSGNTTWHVASYKAGSRLTDHADNFRRSKTLKSLR